jgi:nicotinate dehydrogenase subunit B
VTDQVEGGIIQNISRALWEEVTFNRSRVTSLDWSSYRIIKFPEIPDAVEVVLLDRPDQRPQRVGEPPSEVVWPALGNAIYDAIGVRIGTCRSRPRECSSLVSSASGSILVFIRS